MLGCCCNLTLFCVLIMIDLSACLLACLCCFCCWLGVCIVRLPAVCFGFGFMLVYLMFPFRLSFGGLFWFVCLKDSVVSHLLH